MLAPSIESTDDEQSNSFSFDFKMIKYLFIHELTICLCGIIYYFLPNIGVIFLALVPSISIIFINIYHLKTSYKHLHSLKHEFTQHKFYIFGIIIFVYGCAIVPLIYKINMHFSLNLWTSISDSNTTIYQIYNLITSKLPNDNNTNLPKLFSSIMIAPLTEELSKYILILISLPFILQYSKYESNQTLWLMFMGICGSCGISLIENICYLVTCHYGMFYCFPATNKFIGMTGLARGMISVPFHSITACMTAFIFMKTFNFGKYYFFKNNIDSLIKYIGMIIWIIVKLPLDIWWSFMSHSFYNFIAIVFKNFVHVIWFIGLTAVSCCYYYIGIQMIKEDEQERGELSICLDELVVEYSEFIPIRIDRIKEVEIK